MTGLCPGDALEGVLGWEPGVAGTSTTVPQERQTIISGMVPLANKVKNAQMIMGSAVTGSKGAVAVVQHVPAGAPDQPAMPLDERHVYYAEKHRLRAS